MNRHPHLVVVPASILDGEENDQYGNQKREERRDREHEEVEGIDLPGLHRALNGKQRKIREHRRFG